MKRADLPWHACQRNAENDANVSARRAATCAGRGGEPSRGGESPTPYGAIGGVRRASCRLRERAPPAPRALEGPSAPDGNGLDLDASAGGQRRDLDGRTRRVRRREVAAVDLVHRGELGQVDDEDRGLHDVGEAETR